MGAAVAQPAVGVRGAADGAGIEVKSKEKKFFSEEKNQKTFDCWRWQHAAEGGRLDAAGKRAKVFWFFSSEKNTLLFLVLTQVRQ
jgi:hypothetical protein